MNDSSMTRRPSGPGLPGDLCAPDPAAGTGMGTRARVRQLRHPAVILAPFKSDFGRSLPAWVCRHYQLAGFTGLGTAL